VTHPDDRRQHRLVVKAITLFFVGVVLLWGLYLVRTVVLLLYVAGLLAIGFSPIVRRLERRRLVGPRRRLPRWAAILVLYLGLMTGVALALLILLPPLVTQIRALWENLPELAQRGQQLLVAWGVPLAHWSWADIARSLPSPELAVTGVFSALQSLVGVVGAIVTVFVLPYYLLIESADMHATFLRLFEEERRPQVARITRAVTEKVGAWLGGQLLLSMVIGSTAALGLWLLGVPYFWVLALLAAIGELIPVVGPILAAIPAIFVGFTVSAHTGVFVAAYFAIQQFIENNFLVPRIMERQVGLSAIAVVVALLVGTELLGLVGALLAVPSAAIVQVLFQEFLGRETPEQLTIDN
jgi:predicted PurR-regulated permease PerM